LLNLPFLPTDSLGENGSFNKLLGQYMCR
jgi:hypothetical protein